MAVDTTSSLPLASSRYVEDANPPGHRSVWGSWYDADQKAWGFACCRALDPHAPPCAETDRDAVDASREPTVAEELVAASTGLVWRPREEFETPESFIAHASKCLASQWLKWLQDGTLRSSADASSVDAELRKVLLSEEAAKEAIQQVKNFGHRLVDGISQKLSQSLEEFCSCVGEQEYVKANKAYMDIVMGARKWQGDVPYLVEGNRNGPSVVQNVAERINKINSNPLDEAGIRDHAVLLRRLMRVAQVVLPNQDPSRNCG